jgi:hypothetical protein
MLSWGGIGAVTIIRRPCCGTADVAFGAMLGWGWLELTLRQSNGGSGTRWRTGSIRCLDGWLAGQHERTLSSSYFLWAPY